MYTAYLTLREHRTQRVVGRRGLLRVVTTEAPGIRGTVHVASHLGSPVLRLRGGSAVYFREDLRRVLNAIDACGYIVEPDFTASAERALRDGGMDPTRVRGAR